MGNMNILPYPIFDYLRCDGRQLYAVNRIDFCNLKGTEPTICVEDQPQPLRVNALFGLIVRYQWRQRDVTTSSGRRDVRSGSTRVHLQGLYSGEHTDIPIADRDFAPGSQLTSPVMDVKLWRDAFKKVDIGKLALAYAGEGCRLEAVEIDLDHRAVMEEMNIHPLTKESQPYLGTVQVGGLYYVPPLQA